MIPESIFNKAHFDGTSNYPLCENTEAQSC
jgi:hypothetical protein